MYNFSNKFQEYEFPMLNLIRLPEIYISEDEKTSVGLKKDATNFEFLCELAKHGYKKYQHKLNKELIPDYKQRAKYELGIFNELGFVDYVLLVWRVINRARDLGAYLDPGRGSSAGSFIFALLNITGTLDVIEKGLIFERFISRARSKKTVINGITYIQGDLAPDVDLNFGGVRPQIIEWLNTLYQGKTAKISAVSTLTSKILIKDVHKIVDEASEDDACHVANLIEKFFGIVEDIEDIPEKNKHFKTWTETYPLTFQIALKLRNLIRQKTSHPSGLFISYDTVNEFYPLELNKEKEITLPFEMSDAAKLGIKLDLLGLTCCSVIKEISKHIDTDLAEINLDSDSIIYDQFQSENLLPYGLYQISADCMFRVLQEIKPKNILELSDANAIARPGALDYLHGYVENIQECPHILFKDILKPTRNFCLYQEQMMQMLVAVGFSLDEAEICRKIVGKKMTDKVQEWEQKIQDKVKENNLPNEISGILWKILNDSAKYSFNRSHSISVSKLGALTVYLKYKYPLFFYLACLKAAVHQPSPIEEISSIQSELSNFNIQLLPPHILKSNIDFEIEGNNIRFGLGNIKGISEKSIDKLNKFKNKYSNKFEIFHAANEAKIPLNILSSLIMVGSLDDCLTQTRSKTFLEACLWNILTPKEKLKCLELGEKFKFNLIDLVKALNSEIKTEKGVSFIKDSRMGTIRGKFQPHYELYNFNKKNENFAKYFFEKVLIGFSYSTKLIDIFQVYCQDLVTIEQAKSLESNDLVHFVGEVIFAKTGKSKEKKTPYFKCQIQDFSGSITVLMFDTNYSMSISECRDINNRLPMEGDIVVVKGIKKNDAVFANKIGIQDCSILQRISQLEQKKKDSTVSAN